MKLVHAKELPIDRASQKALISARLAIFNSESNALAERLYTGDMTIGQWEEAMRLLVKDVHSGAAAILNGGWDKMNFSLWGKLGTPMRKQYKFLHGFAEWIDANKDTATLGQIQARAHMYGQAALGPAMTMALPQDIVENLPWMPKDGTTECLTNCKCVWVLTSTKTRRKKLVTATWRMSQAEHCSTCSKRSGYKVTFEVSANVIVPAFIGGY